MLVNESFPSVAKAAATGLGSTEQIAALKAFLAWCACYFLPLKNGVELRILDEIQENPGVLENSEQTQRNAKLLNQLLENVYQKEIEYSPYNDAIHEEFIFQSQVIQALFNSSVDKTTLINVCQQACDLVVSLIMNRHFNANAWPGGYYYMIDDPVYQETKTLLCNELTLVIAGFMNSEPAKFVFELSPKTHKHIARMKKQRLQLHP